MRRWNTLVLAIGLTLSCQVAQAATIVYSTLLAGNVTKPPNDINTGVGGAFGRTAPYISEAFASSFVAPTTVTIDGANLGIGRLVVAGISGPGSPLTTGNSFTLEFCSDNGGAPGTVLRSVTVADGAPTMPSGGTIAQHSVDHPLVRFAFGSTLNITSGTRYWPVLRGGTNPDSYAGWMKVCQDASSWTIGEGKRQQSNDPNGPWMPFWSDHVERYANGSLQYCAGAFAITAP